MAAMIGSASPASAKSKEKAKAAKTQAARTWSTVIDYVFANGTERTLKAPLSRRLGFDSDAVVTKALRYKLADSPDKKNHAFYVLSAENSEGKPHPTGFVIGNAVAVTIDGVKSVTDFFWRVDLNGNIITAVKSEGPAGQVKETVLTPDSPEGIAGFKTERKIYLETMDLKTLSK